MGSNEKAQGGARIGSVLVIDDHPLYGEALGIALGEVFPGCEIRTQTTLAGAIAALDEGFSPELIMLDLKLPDVTGISGFQSLRTHVPDVPITVISALTSSEVIEALMAAGAAGFIPKDISSQGLRTALGLVRDGHRYVPPSHHAPPPSKEQGRGPTVAQICDRIADLTPQQARIMKLICAGKPNKQIAYEMSLAEATVKAHITALLRRLGVQNRTQAAVLVENANIELGAGMSDADARSFLSQ
ncbi:LuxR C-terminal-related transcriptional regulator [Profundibacterium mesophilum]|uniref:Two component transcriptional regulator LuxR family protein n=1 Tax=Profundibacterium mesophilum KAUST100406-0324 TaxID=1037889 RepID=A0A921TB26_9RHOB|nr:response regulator transcription factor [Profundibacterium mesophilum]KAF0674700.1 Two component transcriptional regulator LuxR family protein [Profundibacterium mesophilum KAUST100406-0324]